MVRFDYECECGLVAEVFAPMKEIQPTLPCECGGTMKKLINGLAGHSTRNCLGEDSSAMGPGEIHMHRAHQKDIEKAAREGTLESYKEGKRTPSEFRPQFERTHY